MSLRDRVRVAVESDQRQALKSLVASESRAVRHLVTLSYRPEESIRSTAAYGLGQAARHHPKLAREVLKRLVWAMSEESNTNAEHVPEVVLAMATQEPELLIPVVPDLLALAKDPDLGEGIAEILRTVAEHCPGTVGKQIAKNVRGPGGNGANRG